MTRLQKLLRSVRREDKILEIGPSYNPIAPKRKGWNTKILDYCSREQLVAKYRAIHLNSKYDAVTLDLNQIEEVDFVWQSGAFESAVNPEERGTFDVCIASHVIEHTPDLVGFIRSIETLLKPSGLIILAIPDKRYCFDYFQSLSSTGNVIDAMGISRHSRGKVFNSVAYGILQNQKETWGPGLLSGFEMTQNLDDCYTSIRDYAGAPNDPYIDRHGWFFTPNSFHLIMLELGQLGLIGCHVHEQYSLAENEFFVSLRLGSPDPLPNAELNRQRLKLLTSIQVDLLEQASYNRNIRLPLGWRLKSYLGRLNGFKANLASFASRTWLSSLYEAYKHFYRDRSINLEETYARLPVWRKYYNPFRDAATYVIRQYHYRLTIRTRLASRWRRLHSTAANSVPSRIIKPLATTPQRSLLFVTYHPQGFISDHVKYLVANFKRVGFSVILIKVVDDISHPLADSSIDDADGAMVRKNSGYDFGAWAHGIQTFPELFQGSELLIANDSMFGPVSPELFGRLLENIEKSEADLVGLTESHQYNRHYQSYFLVFRNLSQHADEVQKYWNNVRNIENKRDVIFEYELDLMQHFSKIGFRCCVLFPVKSIALDHNPTFYGWRQLLDAGFPFLKVPLLKPNVTEVDNTTCREVFGRLGYNSQLIDDHFQTMNRKF